MGITRCGGVGGTEGPLMTGVPGVSASWGGGKGTEPLSTPAGPTSVIVVTPVVGGSGEDSDAGPSIGVPTSKAASRAFCAPSGAFTGTSQMSGECSTFFSRGVQLEGSGVASASSGFASAEFP